MNLRKYKILGLQILLLNQLFLVDLYKPKQTLATEDINTEYTGDEMEIGFNSKYILEMINNLEDEKVILRFNDSSSPVIATEDSNPNLLYVLMPMRV